jgi:small conductance mechanosensitive channel
MEQIFTWLTEHGLRIILIIAAGFIAVKIGRVFIGRTIRRAVNHSDPESEKRREDTLIGIFNGVLKAVVWLMVIMTVLPEFGIEIGPILAGAGVIGVALGFGAQWMVRDFLAGLMIIFEDQFRVGDVVCLDNTCGGVEDVTIRKTVLRDLDGKLYHIPNGSFKMAANLTKDYSRAYMKLSVAYKEDLDKVIDLVNKVGEEMAGESPWKEYIKKPIGVMGPGPSSFGDSGIELQVLGETKPLKQWDTLKEFRRRLKVAFDKENIEIPFPQMSVWPKGKWEK